MQTYIIANSTYGWWGAWLNANAGKMVITPDTWLIIFDISIIRQDLHIHRKRCGLSTSKPRGGFIRSIVYPLKGKKEIYRDVFY
jgi:hypothetical protein